MACSNRTLVALLLIGAVSLSALPAGAEPVVLKVATVAPKDSPWMDSFTAMNAEVEKATAGNVSFKFFPGMVSGDEKDMVRKMRAGQLQGAALTGVGLQMIEPNSMVLQLPMLFKSYEELDKVRDKLEPKLQGFMAKKGFIILGWADLGYTYLFTQTPVDSLASFKDVKMWGWEDEPISKRFFEMAGISQVSLSLPDVLPGLQRGMITGVYNSPLGAISLQWDKHVKHITGMAIGIGIGATVITKAQWDKISADDQAKVMEIAKRHHVKLCAEIRKRNKEAVATLKKQGLTIVTVPKPELDRFVALAARVRADLAAKMFEKGLLQEVEGLIKSVR